MSIHTSWIDYDFFFENADGVRVQLGQTPTRRVLKYSGLGMPGPDHTFQRIPYEDSFTLGRTSGYVW